jgi:polysaccharide pyruvyl transferase WcaK-like protein
MKKTIYIADSYSLNTGDIGILMATVAELRRTLPDAILYIESSHPQALADYDLDCDIFPRIFDISKIVSATGGGNNLSKFALIAEGLKGLHDSLTFWLFALFTRMRLPGVWWVRPSRRAQAKALKNVDLWLSSGGGYLSSFYRPEFRFYGYALARLLGKPYFIFAQSVGPFHTWLHKKLARFYLNRAAGILIREDDSYHYMQDMGLKKPVVLTADIAFLLPFATGMNEQQNPTLKAAAICVKKSDKNYNTSMLRAARRLADMEYAVYFVSQTPNDDQLAEALQQKIGAKSTAIIFGMDPRIVKQLYGRCELIIATRMHALIFAVEQGVPWIGIGYEPKFRGLSNQLGKTGILIEEKDLTPATIDKAIKQVLKLPALDEHPARALVRKARENTAAVLQVLENNN